MGKTFEELQYDLGRRKMNRTVEIVRDDHLETLRRCGGYYACPKDDRGRRLGPLVGYAGKYQAPGGEQKQWVGEIYANFAKAEEYPEILFHFADSMEEKLEPLINRIDIFCGAPIGGYDFSKMLGLAFGRRAIKAEKKVIALTSETAREQSKLVFARHNIEKGARYAIVEDVCNNFSTTAELIAQILLLGGEITVIVCLLNRSLEVDDYFFNTATDMKIPVASLVRLPISEYHQDDPFVVDDIKRNNVAWKPKDEWDRLMEAMSAHS